MTPIEPLTWLNGSTCTTSDISPSIGSHTLHYGTGVFEGLMAYGHADGHKIFRASEHLTRFCLGCERFGLRIPWSPSTLLDGCCDLLSRLDSSITYYLRPIAYLAAPQLPLTGALNDEIADVAILAMAITRRSPASITCCLSSFQRVSSKAIPVQWKICACYANSFLARREAQRLGHDDAILLGSTGQICEATAANIFIVQGSLLLTPSLDQGDIFPGITRKLVLEIAGASGINTIETDLYPRDLERADAAMLTATLMEVKLMGRIGEQPLRSETNAIAQRIVREFNQIISES